MYAGEITSVWLKLNSGGLIYLSPVFLLYSPWLMKFTTSRIPVIFKCILTARIDVNRLLQLKHMESIIHTLSECASEDGSFVMSPL
jgi:hypothetical protein